MNTPSKVPVTFLTGSLGSGKTALLNRILSDQRGTGHVHGPEQGYVRCKRGHPDGRLRTQTLPLVVPFSPGGSGPP